MTPAEHELAAAKARMIAQGAIIDYLTDVVRMNCGTLPEPFRSARQAEIGLKLAHARELYTGASLPTAPSAALSDLHAALFQEAFDEISLKVAEQIARGITPEERAAIFKPPAE